MTIQGGTAFGRGITTVGDHNMLLAGSHIGHDAAVGSHIVFTNGAMAAGHTEIGDRAVLGAMVGIHQFTRVGELAMVGAGAMLSHDAPPFAIVQGDRVRRPGNTVGLQSNLGHTQHLNTRCMGDLGADPATLSGLLQSQAVAELLSTAVDEQIVQATQTLVTLLDDRAAQAKAPAKSRFWFRGRAASPEEAAPLPPRVSGQLAVLRGLLSEVPVVTLEDVVDFYDARFHAEFTAQEKADLVAFLRTL